MRIGNEVEIAQKAYVLLKQQGLMKRLIWGSDWSHTQYESIVSYEPTVQTFKQIVTDEKEQYLILSENATHLFKF